MIKEIKEILGSGFEVELFESALYNLADKKNKLRYNNFAYSIRELSRHFLHRLAPEDSVKLCSWFKTETANNKPTRTQRIKYAIQGGITDITLSALGFDTDELKEEIRSIKKMIDSLSKFTHINPESFRQQDKEVDELGNKVLAEFKSFAETIKFYTAELRSYLDGKIEDHMIMGVVENYYENIDMLASNHSINYSDITDYHIEEINHNSIIVAIHGDIHFTLEYGSRKERREDDGLDMHETFPFETRIHYEINSKFPSKNYTIENFDVNTDSWYGEISDEELDKMIDEDIKKKNNGTNG